MERASRVAQVQGSARVVHRVEVIRLNAGGATWPSACVHVCMCASLTEVIGLDAGGATWPSAAPAVQGNPHAPRPQHLGQMARPNSVCLYPQQPRTRPSSE
eukprot:CAMPEP_0174702400 /NCGR_PEP_ID=MMETSP1094-20130205/6696_1 /TAXON_ID=156173 /ORGANISM="Chrysochromulina brevifilum, Strain UTEX LB 985" /LENGTH=100 /DNA_ID=CAMNT_0015900171 /DNA_START=923 /DNA_END=1222 /DNA_ORIENTATION=+